ncbi:MAG: hypothetical protein HY820_35410 [Acidobacteria bacterium]|nr:hypothetical protein [Acidobacteriota bacterium]
MKNERVILRAAYSTTKSCPELVDFLDRVERGDQGALNHVEECPRCAAELALYREVAEGPTVAKSDLANLDKRVANQIAATTTTTTGSWWRRILRPAYLTPAIATVAVLLFVVNTRSPRTGLPNEYGSVERAQSVELLSPKGEVAEAPLMMRWTEVSGAASYRVRIFEVDRNQLWEVSIKSTSTAIPSSVRKQALPGKRLIWSVEALNSAGKTIATGTQDFRKTVARPGAQ